MSNDLDFALEQAREARSALDQALTGYERDLVEYDGADAIIAAFHATDTAIRAVEADRKLEAYEERIDPELRWEDDRIQEAEEARAREEA